MGGRILSESITMGTTIVITVALICAVLVVADYVRERFDK
jgi:hypothetical protein